MWYVPKIKGRHSQALLKLLDSTWIPQEHQTELTAGTSMLNIVEIVSDTGPWSSIFLPSVGTNQTNCHNTSILPMREKPNSAMIWFVSDIYKKSIFFIRQGIKVIKIKMMSVLSVQWKSRQSQRLTKKEYFHRTVTVTCSMQMATAAREKCSRCLHTSSPNTTKHSQ